MEVGGKIGGQKGDRMTRGDRHLHNCMTEQGLQSPGLTKREVKDLEKVQKVALKIVLGEHYISYDVACTLVNISPLQYRRVDLCTKFAIKLYKSPISKDFLTPAEKNVNTRSEKQLLVTEPVTRTHMC